MENEMMKVKVILRNRGVSLVEYIDEDGHLQRVYVPTESIVEEDGQMYSDQVYTGSPFGVPWAEMVDEMVLNPNALEHHLRRYGIWEYSDLVTKPDAVRAAFNSAFKGLVDTLKANALEFEKEGV